MSDPFAGLRHKQPEHAQKILRALLYNKAAIDASDTGCHAKGTRILMYDGSDKAVEDIAVGDLIMGWDSTPRTVLRLARGRERMARIVPVKGEPFIVNESHLLTLVQTNSCAARPGEFSTNGRILDVTVREWQGWIASMKHRHKLFRASAITCWPTKQFLLDPYHLGVLLGDGACRNEYALSICKPDPEMAGIVGEIATAFQCHIRIAPGDDKHCVSYYFTSSSALWAELSRLGVAGCGSGDKAIPSDYLAAGVEQRRALLAGLLDTDGHQNRQGGYDFISKSQALAKGLVFLCRSLGIAAYLKPTEKYCQTGAGGVYWRVTISGDCDQLPMRIERKKARPRTQKKSVLRTGFRVEYLPEDDYYGFSISGDGRFLLGDFTVTHNTGKTYSSLVVARIFQCAPLILGPKATRAGWEDAAKLMGVDIQFLNYEKARRDSYGLGFEKPHGSGSYWVWNVRPVMMIFDEAHLCGGSTSLTGKLLRSSRKAAEYVLVLSATLADNPTQMKNVGQTLGLFDGKGYYHWLQRHGVHPDYTGAMAWTDDPEKQRAALAKIHAALFPSRGARLRRCEIPGFPETQIDTLLLEPEADVSEASKQLADGGELADRMAARQVLEEEIVEQLQSPILAEIENNCCVAVFLNFRNALDKASAWAKKKKISHGIIDGRQTGEKGDAERRETIRRFQTNEDKLVFVNCAAGGAGLNLHDPQGLVERVSFIVPSENGRQMKQVCGRVHRTGGAFSRQYFCGLRGTIQEDNLKSNQTKIRNIDTLNGDDLDSLIFI